jgi:hypothetical protein
MAIKWIGNAGSHAVGKEKISRDNVIEVMEIFSHALNQLYDQKPKILAKKIANINKKKGI